MQYMGMKKDIYLETSALIKQCKSLSLPVDEDKSSIDDVLGDYILTPQQARHCVNSGKRRRKRTIWDFSRYPSFLWPLPIRYKYSGNQSAEDRKMIEGALRHWEQHTCIRFVELDVSAEPSEQYLLFINQPIGCISYVGRVGLSITHPQPLNLQPIGCTAIFGRAVHEIGHAIGYWHQHQRTDRDNYVNVVWDNVGVDRRASFDVIDDAVSDTADVEYDFGSVMHYGPEDNTIAAGKPTLLSKNPLYQYSLGQRTTLSYHDAKLANIAYCSDSCVKKLRCQNGGYTDPNKCQQCRCPEGLGGTLCDTTARASGGCFPSSSAVIDLSSSDEFCVSSREYQNGASYQHGDQCNWWIKAPRGCTIDVRFDGEFSVYRNTYTLTCNHWVEIKYGSDLSSRGARFCGDKTPDLDGRGVITTTSNQLLLVFNAEHPIVANMYTPLPTAAERRGFKLCYRISDSKCLKTRGKPPKKKT